jgi:amino acid efflux transporter
VHRGAIVAFASSLALLGLTARYLVPQLVVAAAAIVWLARTRPDRPGPHDVIPTEPPLAPSV